MAKLSTKRRRKEGPQKGVQEAPAGFFQSKILAASVGLVGILVLAGGFALWRSSQGAGTTVASSEPAPQSQAVQPAPTQAQPPTAAPAPAQAAQPAQAAAPLAQGPQTQPSQAQAAGKPAPTITLSTLDGEFPVGADTGKTLVLYFSFVG